MNIYLYAKSGHSVGLDATRRCSAIAKILQDKGCDPILCTSDFRAGAYAKELFDIKKYVSVDILSNLPNIMQRGDILIYDTDEASDFMKANMKDFCSLLYKIPEDIPYTITNNIFLDDKKDKTIEKLFFFGDDDYNNLLLDLCKDSKSQDISLLLGHYFFLGNEEKLVSYFNKILNEESYIDSIKNTKYLLSGSLNACLESLRSGGKPVLLKREDKRYDENLIESLKLPTIEINSFEKIINQFETIIEKYPKINLTDKFDMSQIINDIFVKLETYKKIKNNS